MKASLSAIFGLVCSLIAWLVTAKKECGDLSVSCTGSNNPMLAGNVVALLAPMVLIPIFTLVFGLDHYDWKSMMDIRKGDDHELASEAHMDLEYIPGGHIETVDEFEEEQRKLRRAGTIAKTTTVVMTLAFLVLWPMPMYGSGYIFSKPFFTGWVVVGIIWIFCSLFAVGIFPVYEGRMTLYRTLKMMLTGKKPTPIHGRPEPEEVSAVGDKETRVEAGDVTPEKKD
jgi:urea-proton symporter